MAPEFWQGNESVHRKGRQLERAWPDQGWLRRGPEGSGGGQEEGEEFMSQQALLVTGGAPHSESLGSFIF